MLIALSHILAYVGGGEWLIVDSNKNVKTDEYDSILHSTHHHSDTMSIAIVHL